MLGLCHPGFTYFSFILINFILYKISLTFILIN